MLEIDIPANLPAYPPAHLPTYVPTIHLPTQQTATPAALQGPAITSEERAEERSAYKRTFYEALELRMNRALAERRRVLVVGDLNISPAPADTAEPRFTDERFYSERWDRRWLRRLLGKPGAPGQWRDTFR